jgi:hypothetical protein
MSIKLLDEDKESLYIEKLYIQHNHDTSIKAISSGINSKLSEISNLYNVNEINSLKERKDIVSISKGNLKDDLQNLITQLDTIDLPKIVIAKSSNVSLPEYKTQLQLRAQESIKITNPNDETDFAYMDGSFFEYSTQCQVIIINKDEYATLEIQLEMFRILNELRTIDYNLKIFKESNVSDFYVLDNFGYVSIDSFVDEWQFQEQDGYKFSFLDFKITESYFKMKSADMYRKFELLGTIK